ncbi:hypothetical protein ACH9D2_03525 [Kocuria sp. M4R2S49]|uniref:hypothetical protein n=1 Tax=Kocuria rhizosphaericola TaxID=3376284 RepID=UPI0037A334B2
MTTSATPTAAGPAGEVRPAGRARRRRLLPAVFLLGLGGILGGAALAQEEVPSTPLGAVAPVPGGLARVNGVLPDVDVAPRSGDERTEDGTHRVRVLLELTAMEPDGIDFRADDWVVERLGGGVSPVLRASVAEESIPQGEVLLTELVVEVPDRALELTLDGAGDARLSLGSDHHRGGGPR